MSDSNIIYAEQAEVGKTYLLVLSPNSVYRLTIVSQHDGSVSVRDERQPQVVSISKKTALMEYDEEFYNKSKKQRPQSEQKITSFDDISKDVKEMQKPKKTGEPKMARTKNPKSAVIDKLLAETPVSESGKVDFDTIAKKANEILGGTEEDLKNLVALVRVRNWHFTKGGKVNKFKHQDVSTGEVVVSNDQPSNPGE